MTQTADIIQDSPWIPITPTFKQLAFITLPHRQMFFGGAAGGGKSEGLLAAAALHANTPGYVAMLFRRSYADLRLKGALLDRANEWWEDSPAHWNSSENRWEFPSGATIGFGYLDNPNDHLRYKSMEAQFIGCDEATDMRTTHLKYMISRLRRKAGVEVPTRMRYAGNPGGESHVYFGDNFVHPEHEFPVRPFIPATLEDNPHADRADYELSLAEMDEIEYVQLRYGAWVQDETSVYFKRTFWMGRNRYNYDDRPERRARTCLSRFAAIDTAEKKEDNNAFSAIVVGEINREWKLDIVHAVKARKTFDELPEWVSQQLWAWNFDEKLAEVFVEDASSGTQLIQVTEAGDSWLEPLMIGVAANPEGKVASWRKATVWCRRNCVAIPQPTPGVPWLYKWEQEVFNAPNSPFLDYADATAMLINEIEDREQHPLSTGWRWREQLRVEAENSGANGSLTYGMGG